MPPNRARAMLTGIELTWFPALVRPAGGKIGGATMKNFANLALIMSCVFAFAANQAQSQSAKAWAGTWKLDTSKSKLHNAAPQSITLHIETMDGQTVKFTANGTGPDGKPFSESFDGKADGKQYPLMVNGSEAGKVSYRRESDGKFSGHGTLPEGTVTESLSLSPDGKTMTVQVQVRSSQGDYDETEVFTKQ